MSTFENRSGRRVCLTELRRRISMIERGSFGTRSTGMLKESGVDQNVSLFSSFMATSNAEVTDRLFLEKILDGEAMSRPALHEFVADAYDHQPAVRDVGFALVASLLRRQGQIGARPMVLWCQRQKDELELGCLYGPGLSGLGLSPDQLIIVTGRRDADCLWAMEQGLSSKSLVAVIGAVDQVGLIASRRLALSASAHGTWCLLLPARHGREPSAAETRWRIKTASSSPDERDKKLLGQPRWQLTLERNRHGRTGRWIAEWDHAAYRFHLAAPMGVAPARQSGPDKIAGQSSRYKGESEVLAFDRAG